MAGSVRGCDGRPPGRRSDLNGYAGAIGIDFEAIGELEVTADDACALDELALGMIHHQWFNTDQEWITAILDENPTMARDDLALHISDLLVANQQRFQYNDPGNDDPTLYPIFVVIPVTDYVFRGHGNPMTRGTIGYHIIDPFYTVQTYLLLTLWRESWFDVVQWYEEHITLLCNECYGLEHEDYVMQDGGCICPDSDDEDEAPDAESGPNNDPGNDSIGLAIAGTICEDMSNQGEPRRYLVHSYLMNEIDMMTEEEVRSTVTAQTGPNSPILNAMPATRGTAQAPAENIAFWVQTVNVNSEGPSQIPVERWPLGRAALPDDTFMNSDTDTHGSMPGLIPNSASDMDVEFVREVIDVDKWWSSGRCHEPSDQPSHNPEHPGDRDHPIVISSDEDDVGSECELALSAIKTKPVPAGVLTSLKRNASRTKDAACRVPKPVVVLAKVNGQDVRALLDSGLLSDFMSTSLADQLAVRKSNLAKPLNVQLAVQGSRTKVNLGATVRLEYAGICKERWFDIINIDTYDMILGTPFMFQHSCAVGFNPTRVIIDSVEALPIKGGIDITTLQSRAMDLLDNELERAQELLRSYAAPLCQKAEQTDLPPLREVNHRIPIIDESKAYSFRPSRCPAAFLPLWSAKRDQYIKSGRWRFATSTNAAPLMFLKKATQPGEPIKMRNTIDLRECNANTRKLASPLPDQRTILYRVAARKYISSIDGKDAYEQIRIEPSDVKHTLMATPDGTVESLVVQQGDCNAVATFMSLMTRLFSPYLGVWMDVYLDDITLLFTQMPRFRVRNPERLFLIMPTTSQARSAHLSQSCSTPCQEYLAGIVSLFPNDDMASKWI
jgi:hypothetical protein